MQSRFKRVLVITLTLILVSTMIPVETIQAKTKGTIKKIQVTNAKKKKITLYVGKTKKLKVKVKGKGKISRKVTFKSSNKKVATVTKKGKIKAKKAGKTKIIITSRTNKKKKIVIRVVVKKRNNKVEPVAPPIEETTAKPATEVPTTEPPVETTVTPPVEETTSNELLDGKNSGDGDELDYGKFLNN